MVLINRLSSYAFAAVAVIGLFLLNIFEREEVRHHEEVYL